MPRVERRQRVDKANLTLCMQQPASTMHLDNTVDNRTNNASSILSFEEFRDALGPSARKYTDVQINQMRLMFDKLADAVFTNWLRKRNAHNE